jgi:putative spermidine/putrescine transport system permease protein
MRRATVIALWAAFLAPVALLLAWSIAWRWPWPAALPSRWQASAWTDLAATGGLGAAALRSLGIAGVVALVATGLGFVTSRSAAQARSRDALNWLLHLPFALSPVVLGVGLEYSFLRAGLAGRVVGVALAQGILAYAYAVILLSGLWNPRTRAYLDGAATLGAAPRQAWIRVLLPIARPLLALCFVQTFLISWFDYALVLLIGGGRVVTLTTSLYQFLLSGDLRLAAASALLLLLPPLIALAAQAHLRPAALAGEPGL